MTPPAASTEFGKMWLFFARDSNYSDSSGIMPLQHLTLAIPGETLADISPNLDELQSGNLLATWTALWDPVLLAQTASLPAAKPAADVLELPRTSNELVIAPAIIGSEVADRWPADDPLLVYLPTFDRRSQVISHLASVLPGEPLLGAPLAADFFAFGFAYLQIELLTRSMNYDPQVAQESLRTAVVEAAGAAMAGDETAMVTQLEQAYDLLVQSRNHYYPIDFYLVDLMLTTVSVAGRPLAEACRRASQSNVLVTGELLDHLASSEPDSLVALRQALDEQRLAVCGGSMTSEPLHQLSPESLLANLRDGRAALERHLGRAPTVFAHAAGPMAPLVPGVLHRLGYHASVLANFSGGTLPGSHGSRTTWTGLDNTPIEALAAEPIDMGGHCSMLGLAKQMQRTMNYDLAASLLLVGWPGHRTEWHGDLMQVAKRSAVLGRPITLDEYFDITSSQDYAGTTTADAYPQPATLSVARHNNDRIAALARISGSQQPSPTALHELLTVAADQPANGTLWLNASSVPRRHLGGELPAFGWRWESNSSTAEHPPRCESGVLRNEHLEAVFDERTGGISATRLHAERGNYLSQQLVVEPLGPQGLAAGLQLAFDGWRVIQADTSRGTLASDYRVVDRDAKSLANLRQLTTLDRQQKSLDICVEFEALDERAVHCRLCSRVAVRDEDFRLTRGLQGIDMPTSRSQVAASWVGLGSEPAPLAVLCDGPMVHRRHSGRMLDTRLVEAAGESVTTRLSYVLDCRYPAHDFALHEQPQWIAATGSAPPQQTTGWWLHLGAKNLLVTHLEVEPIERDLLIRLRVLETAGRPVSTEIAAWKAISDAQQLNFLGEPDQRLHTTEGKVRVSFAPYEFLEIEMALSDGR